MENFDLARQGERCTGGFRVLVKRAWRRCGNRLNAIFDMGKRWQRAKAAWRVLGPWWNVLRAGFETFSKCSNFHLARQGQRAMAKRWQGAKAARKGFGPCGGTCFAQVLKNLLNAEFRPGKAEPRRKVHRRVSCPNETCLSQVWKPFKCNIRPSKALAKG